MKPIQRNEACDGVRLDAIDGAAPKLVALGLFSYASLLLPTLN